MEWAGVDRKVADRTNIGDHDSAAVPSLMSGWFDDCATSEYFDACDAS